MSEEDLYMVRKMDTNPGKQVVARTEEGELIELGPDPTIFIGDLDDE